ncbi:hypothetical protein KFK09_008658 [Dendrobium nobile]|uniref:DUF4283 domain-containing protein n=1 Tax=Dendrobium nobile TaxID=94219 RepID=A0A8T3BLQ6_DENNO|nr:hypothetical protein KFK09_008658 [Dendrobium nobile]
MNLFASTQIGLILTLVHLYNKETFHYFLANMSFNSNHSVTSPMFKKKVEITKADLEIFLNLRTEGIRAHTMTTTADFNWTEINEMIRGIIFKEHMPKVSSLIHNAHIIQHVLRTSIIFKAGDRVNITLLLSIVTYLIITKQPIDEALLILDYLYELSQIGHVAHKRKKNIALGYLIAYNLEKKYELIHQVQDFEVPLYYNNGSFRAILNKDESCKAHVISDSEEEHEPATAPASEPNYHDLVQRFDRLESHFDQRFDQIETHLQQQDVQYNQEIGESHGVSVRECLKEDSYYWSMKYSLGTQRRSGSLPTLGECEQLKGSLPTLGEYEGMKGSLPTLGECEKDEGFSAHTWRDLVGRMAADGRRPSLASSARTSSIVFLVIKEVSNVAPKKIIHVEGKGKSIAENFEFITPQLVKGSMVLNLNNPSASSSGMKIFVNRFENSNAIPRHSVINANSPISINKSLHENELSLGGKMDVNVDKVTDEMPNRAVKEVDVNPWSKKPYIKLDFKEEDRVLSNDGKEVRLSEENEILNSNKLLNSLVIKVFGKELPSHMMAWEVRRQWSQFGHFHFTSLGRGWFLCSFNSLEMVEVVLSDGPWFVNGHIVSMDKWSTDFSPLSMKGLTSPIWKRMPHLLLQCWDVVNVARISSMIGKPLMLDGNMFQWRRREFAREPIVVASNYGLGFNGRKRQEIVNDPSYGPWVIVNHKRNRRSIQRNTNVKPMNMRYVKKQSKHVLEIQEDRINVSSKDRIGSIVLEPNNLNANTNQIEEGEITGGLEQCIEDMQAVGTEEFDVQTNKDIQKADGVMGMVLNPASSILPMDVNKFDILSMENDDKEEDGVNEITERENDVEGIVVMVKDEVLVFSDAKFKSIKKMKSIVEDYCKWTGQKINLHKSAMICGKTVMKRRKKKIGKLLGIKLVDEMEYLGTKIALRRNLLAKYGEIWWSNEAMKGGSSSWKIADSGWKALKSFERWNVVMGSNINVLKDEGRRDYDKLFLYFGEDLVYMINGLKEEEIVDTISWIHKLKLNARVELFLWNICKKAIPTVEFLMKRRLANNNFCPRGCGEVEDIDHVTSTCSKLVKVIELLRRWGFRNKVKHGKVGDSVVLIAANVLRFVSTTNKDILLDHWDVNQSPGLFSKTWHPPPPEWYKINIDASLKDNYGAVELLVFRSLKDVLKGSLQDAKGIIIEGDNKNVIKFLHKLYNKPKELGGSIEDEELLVLSSWNNARCTRRFPELLLGKKLLLMLRYFASFSVVVAAVKMQKRHVQNSYWRLVAAARRKERLKMCSFSREEDRPGGSVVFLQSDGRSSKRMAEEKAPIDGRPELECWTVEPIEERLRNEASCTRVNGSCVDWKTNNHPLGLVLW